MRQKLFKLLILICAVLMTSLFASRIILAKNQQGNRYFWVYSCLGGDFKYFEYKSPGKDGRARELCEKHAQHEKKYKNATCASCAQVTTAEGKTPEPDAKSSRKK